MMIGERFKALRKHHGLTLRQLGERAKTSPSFLSQIELNRTSPSVSTLSRICRAMGVTLQEFFTDRHPDIPARVVRGSEPREVLTHWGSAELQYLLPRDTQHSFSALRLVIQARGASSLRAARRSMMELGLVVSGRLRFQASNQSTHLEAGDSVYFDLAHPHKWTNLTDDIAEVLLINSNFTEVFNLPEPDNLP